MYKLLFSKQASKDSKKIGKMGLKPKVNKLLRLIENNPLEYPPSYEFLLGKLKNQISRRINKQHRLVYEVFEDDKMIKIYRMYTHYE